MTREIWRSDDGCFSAFNDGSNVTIQHNFDDMVYVTPLSHSDLRAIVAALPPEKPEIPEHERLATWAQSNL